MSIMNATLRFSGRDGLTETLQALARAYWETRTGAINSLVTRWQRAGSQQDEWRLRIWAARDVDGGFTS